MTDHLTKTQQILRKLKPDLITRYHVDTIGLFGSIVRSDFSPNSSDIDIIVSFTHPVGIEFIDLSNMLERELNGKVDLVSRNEIKRKYLDEIEKEIVYV